MHWMDWIAGRVMDLERRSTQSEMDRQQTRQKLDDVSSRVAKAEATLAKIVQYGQIALIALVLAANLGREATIDIVAGLLKRMGG